MMRITEALGAPSMNRVLVIGVLVAAGCSALSPVRPVAQSVIAAPDWERVFTRKEGWTGADGAATVALPRNRVLWLFGDTWIGPVVGGRHGPGSTMVSNTIAVSPVSRSPAEIRFLWSEATGKPAAWAIPAQAAEWYWPASGGVLVPRAEGGGERLLLFMSRMARIDTTESVWNFRARGTSVLIVDNPADEPEVWRTSQRSLTALSTDKGTRVLMWGAGAAMVPGRTPGSEDVLILGIDETNVFDKKLVAARAPCETVERLETWRFWDGRGWGEGQDASAAVADGLSSEISLHRMEVGGRDCMVVVYSEGNLGAGILARTCRYPDGRWSAPVRLYTCPEPGADTRVFAYSAKAHPELSRPGELLVSYSVNSTDFRDVVEHADTYRPRFVRVSREMLPAAAPR
jgi:hypothetical protein